MSSMSDRAGDAQDQITRLREQVEALMRDRVTPVLASAADRAQSVYGQASDIAHDQADALGGRVREQPLVAVLVAAGVGYLVGRIVR